MLKLYKYSLFKQLYQIGRMLNSEIKYHVPRILEDFDEQVESILIKIDEEKQESIKVAGMVNERPM